MRPLGDEKNKYKEGIQGSYLGVRGRALLLPGGAALQPRRRSGGTALLLPALLARLAEVGRALVLGPDLLGGLGGGDGGPRRTGGDELADAKARVEGALARRCGLEGRLGGCGYNRRGRKEGGQQPRVFRVSAEAAVSAMNPEGRKVVRSWHIDGPGGKTNKQT